MTAGFFCLQKIFYLLSYLHGNFAENPKKAIEKYRPAAEKAHELGLGMNAGHDLNLKNLKPFVQAFPWTAEVSIGHAIVCDALYLGIQETIQEYLDCLKK